MSTTTVSTLELRAGDRLRLGFGLGDVTVYGVDESGYVNRDDEPIYYVRYVQTDQTGERRGNSAAATSTWELITPLSECDCVPHVTRMTNWGFHCETENQGYCNFECPHNDE